MEKDFDAWNIEKQNIEITLKTEVQFKERDVWWCSIGINIGYEISGKDKFARRPVLVVKKLSQDTCIVIPLTTRRRVGSWFYSMVIHGIPQTLLLQQIRFVDTKRFQRRIIRIEETDFYLIKEKLRGLLGSSI